MSGDFDWGDEDFIFVHEQPKTAVYLNPHGQVVVRQEEPRDEDQFVFFSVEFAETIARAILAAAGVEPDVVLGRHQKLLPPPKSGSTGAERSRRYRERRAQRDGVAERNGREGELPPETDIECSSDVTDGSDCTMSSIPVVPVFAFGGRRSTRFLPLLPCSARPRASSAA